MRALLAIPLLFAFGCASTNQAQKPRQAQNESAPLDFAADSPCSCGDGGECACAMDGSGCSCEHD